MIMGGGIRKIAMAKERD